MNPRILLINPKYAHNVGAAVRAASVFGAQSVWWTGDRVNDDIDRRLPREERLRDYRARVDFVNVERPFDLLNRYAGVGYDGGLVVPVCVEYDDTAEPLDSFEHPERAAYVFGPEDGSVPKWARRHCHRFVTIPSDGCLNLAAAINVVLYDRVAKARQIDRLVNHPRYATER